MIDVWDLKSYGDDVSDYIQRHRRTIALHRERALELDKLGPPIDPLTQIPTNEHYPAYMEARDGLVPILRSQCFRAFHYTRMTDGEIDRILRDGIRMTSLELLRERLENAVSDNLLPRDLAERIHSCSALRSPHEFGERQGFWTTACPIDVKDSAVEMLVAHWGGESSYFPFMGGSEDSAMLDVIRKIGRGRILEIEVPMSSTKDTGPISATRTVFDVVERSLGYKKPLALDFNSLEPLPPEAIRRVISEGERDYRGVAAGYNYATE
tara:strand:+ start:2948 stop:3748 length:801 start_codon:yes stop_codon:yes gene_type:complete